MKFLVLFCHRVRQAHLYSFYSRLHLRRDAQAGLLKNHLQLFRLSHLRAAGMLCSVRIPKTKAQADLFKDRLQLFTLSMLKAAGLLYSMRLNQGLTSLKAMALWNV